MQNLWNLDYERHKKTRLNWFLELQSKATFKRVNMLQKYKTL